MRRLFLLLIPVLLVRCTTPPGLQTVNVHVLDFGSRLSRLSRVPP